MQQLKTDRIKRRGGARRGGGAEGGQAGRDADGSVRLGDSHPFGSKGIGYIFLEWFFGK